MTGIRQGSETERMMAAAREAITLDLIERSLPVAGIHQVILSTNAPQLAQWAESRQVRVEMDPAGQPFHFGHRLRELAQKYRAQGLLYLGGGSGSLLSTEDIAQLVARVGSTERLLLTNNLYSTDFAAFAPAALLDGLDLPAIDNDLGWTLMENAGLTNESLPRNAATQFDIDTPTDLMVLSQHPGVGSHTRAMLDSLALDTAHIAAALKVLMSRDSEVVVAGRASAGLWEYLERSTACRVRMLAEERGMRASGRQKRGEVRSLLGFHYQQVGAARFFQHLSELSQAAFIDSRVLFAHLGLWPSASDRYNSDLRRPERIENQQVRELTEGASRATIPVVLGGHSLVSGGMYALVEAAQARAPDTRTPTTSITKE
jgi:hypothetical protein